MTAMHSVRAYLTQAQRRALQAISKSTGAPMAALIRRAVEAYLKGAKS